MKDRLQILSAAQQTAHEIVDMSSCLSDETLSGFRNEDFTDQQIIAKLAGEFLEEAVNSYDEDEYAEE